MTADRSVLSPADAATALLWLAEMGADEIIADEAINRFAEVQTAPSPARQTTTAPEPRPEPRQDKNAVKTAAGSPPKFAMAQSLAELAQMVDQFDDHSLKKTASRHCLHSGAAQARVLVLVDRPRADEDRSGLVLAGKHEVLAERMLSSIGLRGTAAAPDREKVALVSFLPWRPPGNRAPTDLECRMILPVVERAIALIGPQVILALGALPGQYLNSAPASIAGQRGKWQDLNGTPMLATFHPETLLKSPASKRLAWHDLLALRAKLDELT